MSASSQWTKLPRRGRNCSAVLLLAHAALLLLHLVPMSSLHDQHVSEVPLSQGRCSQSNLWNKSLECPHLPRLRQSDIAFRVDLLAFVLFGAPDDWAHAAATALDE